MDEEPGIMGDGWVMIGWWGRVGMNGSGEWTSKGIITEAKGNNGELKVLDNCLESSGAMVVLMDDCGDLRMYSSMYLLACWTSRSAMKSGSRIVSLSAFSNFVLNNECSNGTSKGRSSKNNHSLRHELALTNGICLTKLSYFLDFLEIRLGLSTTWAGFGSGLALKWVFIEARISNFLIFFVRF